MADQMEELIREIAAKHGIAVSRDDPILVLQTINNRLLEEGVKAEQVQLEQFKQEMEALSLRWGNDARGKAERILNAALAASKAAMSEIMQEGAVTTVACMRAEIDEALARATDSIRDARRIGMLNVVASCITLAAAAIAMWVVRHQ